LENHTKNFFEKLNRKKQYVEILTWYEKDKKLFSKMERPDLYQQVGYAYYNTFLYKKAAGMFMTAYKLYPKEMRNAKLLFMLATSLKQINKKKQALQVYQNYVRLFPQ